MTCQRCNSTRGDPAAFRVRTDIMDIIVCRRCAEDARDLGLFTARLVEAPTAQAAA